MKNEVARVVQVYATLSAPSLIPSLVWNYVPLLEKYTDYNILCDLSYFSFYFMHSKEDVQRSQILSVVGLPNHV